MGLLGVKIQNEGRGKTYQMLTFLPRSKLSKFFGLFSFLRKYLLARHHWLTIFTFLLIMTRDERKQAPLAQCSTLRVLKFCKPGLVSEVTHKRQSQSRMLSAVSHGDWAISVDTYCGIIYGGWSFHSHWDCGYTFQSSVNQRRLLTQAQYAMSQIPGMTYLDVTSWYNVLACCCQHCHHLGAQELTCDHSHVTNTTEDWEPVSLSSDWTAHAHWARVRRDSASSRSNQPGPGPALLKMRAE